MPAIIHPLLPSILCSPTIYIHDIIYVTKIAFGNKSIDSYYNTTSMVILDVKKSSQPLGIRLIWASNSVFFLPFQCVFQKTWERVRGGKILTIASKGRRGNENVFFIFSKRWETKTFSILHVKLIFQIDRFPKLSKVLNKIHFIFYENSKLKTINQQNWKQ